MNEDFSEVISKFKNILAEKDIEIPNMSEDKGNSSEKTLGFDIDIGTILKIKNMIDIAKEKSSPRIELLNALKPFLKKEMGERLEEYIKITYMITIILRICALKPTISVIFSLQKAL